MRDILKRIFIGVAVGMALFFLKSQVFAATITPTTTQYDARYALLNCNVSSTNCFPDGWGSWQGTVNMGTAILQPADVGQFENVLTELSLKYSYSSGFVAGNTYIFKVRVNITNSQPVSNYIKNWKLFGVRGGSTTSNLDYANISTSTLQRIEPDSDNDKVFYIYISVTPAINVNHIWMYVGGRSAVLGSSYYDNGNVVVRNSGVNYSEGTNSYIQQTTNAVIELTKQFILGNQEVLDVDEPASKDFPSDYDTTDYDNAEQSISNSLDVDVSGLTWDPTTWIYAFNWIWQTLTSFVQINAKVFATITGFLTFSFVGLVLNR